MRRSVDWDIRSRFLVMCRAGFGNYNPAFVGGSASDLLQHFSTVLKLDFKTNKCTFVHQFPHSRWPLTEKPATTSPQHRLSFISAFTHLWSASFYFKCCHSYRRCVVSTNLQCTHIGTSSFSWYSLISPIISSMESNDEGTSWSGQFI